MRTLIIFDLGYSGVLCQTQIDNCASRPCLNGGTCTNGVGSYSCECTSHFTGETCGDEVEGNVFTFLPNIFRQNSYHSYEL